ncbi:unnamed protein product [Danaus chrysippus]|uniref:(African queen) hypothetical protein n=1 Tax=Danaus chrysippus TaxID=151541 RepID=A0A8J2R0U8_9NEOP|nr:unnamed protein product [Danaus chrysippus]
MANKCQHCGKFLSASDGAKCTKCTSMFHRACVNLSPESHIPQKWMCRSCRNSGYIKCLPASLANEERNDEKLNANSANESSLVREIKLLRAELAMVSEEMTSFRLELAKLNSCITEFNNHVDSIEERLSSLEQQKAGSNMDRDDTSQEGVAQLRSDLNDREQECFSNDIEISGLTEKLRENVLHIITLVAKKIGVNLQDVDIVSAQRSGPRRDSLSSCEQARPRPITFLIPRVPFAKKPHQNLFIRIVLTLSSSFLDINKSSYKIQVRHHVPSHITTACNLLALTSAVRQVSLDIHVCPDYTGQITNGRIKSR